MNYKSTLPYIIIVILLVLVCLKQCKAPIPPKPTIIRKVITNTIHDTIPGEKSILTKKIHDTLWKDSIKPAPDYNGLLNQYTQLGDRYYSKYIYTTPYILGKYGTAIVVDTVVQNNIIGSYLSYNITFKDTVSIPAPVIKPTKQIYVGGNLQFSNKELNTLQGGIIYKDRKDNIYQTTIGLNTNGNIIYGVGLYYKIKL